MISWPFTATHLSVGEAIAEALDNLRAEGVLGVITRSAKGCVIVMSLEL